MAFVSDGRPKYWVGNECLYCVKLSVKAILRESQGTLNKDVQVLSVCVCWPLCFFVFPT